MNELYNKVFMKTYFIASSVNLKWG